MVKISLTTQDNGKLFPAEPLLTNMDYIFYRLYRMYEKHGDPPCLSAVIHLCYSLGISLIIAFFAIKEWYDMQHKYAWFLEGLYSLYFLLVPLCLLIIYCCIRYYKPQNKMFRFYKTFCSKITLVNTIQNVILNPI